METLYDHYDGSESLNPSETERLRSELKFLQEKHKRMEAAFLREIKRHEETKRQRDYYRQTLADRKILQEYMEG